MTDYSELVKALRSCAENFGCPIECPRYSPADEGVRACVSRLEKDAAAAIEELQSILTEADKKQAYQHDYICELVAEKEELQAETERLKAQLPKRGKWVEDTTTYAGPGLSNYKCSLCGKICGTWRRGLKPSELPNWCGNCGADMRAKMEVQE